jgi:translation initiation factor 2B subunit (eIF-2B alpha/beta/delta family)
MGTDLDSRIARVATDRTSGASELLVEVGGVLTEALRQRVDLAPLARDLVRGQPSMAPIWNLVGQALASVDNPSNFAHYSAQLARAPQTLARHAAGLLLIGGGSDALRIVTISYSGTVLLALLGLVGNRLLRVSCADGQPALEGRRMTQRLAAEGVAVTHYADAALAQALDGADAVVVGADAVSPDWFLNKSGTRMLAAAAGHQGVPFYVCATRDKFVSRAIARRLSIRDESPAEVWPAPPPGVTVRNRYFEATPLDLVSAVISDIGVLGAALVPDACHSPYEALLLDL